MFLSRDNRWVPLLSFFLLTVGISALGFYFYHSTAIEFHRQSQDQISSVASMKVKELFDWRQEHFHDAEVILQNKDILSKIRQIIEDSSAVAPESLRWELGAVAKTYGYSAFQIYDASLNLKFSTSKAPHLYEGFMGQLREVLDLKRPRFSDFYFIPDDGQSCFDLIVPIMRKDDEVSSVPLAILLLTVDNSRFITPLIQSWPTPSTSAKVMIAKFSGDEILLMNEMDQTRNAKLSYKRPIGGKYSQGFGEDTKNEGVFEGYDYRDRKVLRAVKHVPESPWYIVAQIDTEEIYAPLRVRAWAMAVSSLALILICSIRLIFWWENVKNDMYRQIIKNIRQRETAEASLKKSEDRISRINECLLGLGNDYVENVNKLTALCGELTGATCALYNNMQANMLYSIGQWRTPPDYKSSDNAEGHICYDLIRRGGERDVMYVPDLSKTGYSTTDPNVKAYKLQSYLGQIVKCEGRPIGSLCIVFQQEFMPSETDYKILGVLATAIGNEERSLLYEKALNASIERFTQISDNAGEWIWEVDTNGMFTYSNRVVETIFGYQPEELVRKKHYSDFFAPEDKYILVKGFGEILKGRKPLKNYINCNVHRNGRKVISECTAVPFYSPSGIFMGYRAVEFDITERKQLEEERLKVQTLKIVELLTRGIAHDFNNLLASILGNISVLKAMVSDNRQSRRILDDAEHACILARTLTGKLMTFAKESKTEKKPINICAFIEDTVAFSLRGTNVAPKFKFADAKVTVEADETQMNQLVSNIVINSVQAMPQGGALDVDISVVNVEEREIPGLATGRYARIAFKDTGVGISAENLGRIFDPYFSTKIHGSGLGLPTSMAIIKNHNGTIIAESEIGRGTAFFVYLPVSELALPANVAVEIGQIKENKFNSKILIMDDEDMVKDMLTRILEYFGCEVVQSSHGREALDLYKNAMEKGKPFHLVIMDLTIPGGMGGAETIVELLKLDPSAKAVVSSGYSVDLPDYRQLGFKAIINKPYTINELDKVLKELL